jgi:hypothetical protein
MGRRFQMKVALTTRSAFPSAPVAAGFTPPHQWADLATHLADQGSIIGAMLAARLAVTAYRLAQDRRAKWETILPLIDNLDLRYRLMKHAPKGLRTQLGAA